MGFNYTVEQKRRLAARHPLNGFIYDGPKKVTAYRPDAGPMLTPEEFNSLRYGQILYSRIHLDSGGKPVRIRVSGAVKLYKKDPSNNYVPVKHGLYDSFYILAAIHTNDWSTKEYGEGK
jgi:hypothetical protein